MIFPVASFANNTSHNTKKTTLDACFVNSHTATSRCEICETIMFLYREASSSVSFGINQSALGFLGRG